MELLNTINEDTICAISTPAGVGGIAVIRVSGTNAIKFVAPSWLGANLETAKSHTVHLGKFISHEGEIIDEVVVTIFRNPKSFTGEDVIEISCHGSVWIQQQIVNALISNGCRAAKGGEFTRRAFMNGKLDLSQAEAVADVIASSSKAAHKIAIDQMRGGFSQMIGKLRDSLLQFTSLLELELDFSEEDVEFADRQKLIVQAEEVHKTLTKLANSFQTGNAIKNGFPVAIIGETNAGKSTLLNRLLHDDKALVSNIKGTTRDVIEDTITLGGMLFRFIDTAGIRDTDDEIESMGIQRAYRKIEEASIILWLIDPTQATDIDTLAKTIMPKTKNKKLIVVINKIDITDKQLISNTVEQINRLTSYTPIAYISAKNDIKVDELEQQLINAAQADYNQNELMVTNARHYDALHNAAKAISRAINGLKAGISGDFIAQDIRETIHYLSEITGEITTHEVLATIFSKFCIGK